MEIYQSRAFSRLYFVPPHFKHPALKRYQIWYRERAVLDLISDASIGIRASLKAKVKVQVKGLTGIE